MCGSVFHNEKIHFDHCYRRPPPFVDSSGGGISALRLVRSVRSCAKSVYVLKTKVSCPAAASGGFVCYWLSGSERGLLPAAPRQPPRYQMWEIPGTRSTPLEPLSASTVWGKRFPRLKGLCLCNLKVHVSNLGTNKDLSISYEQQAFHMGPRPYGL